MFFEQRGKNYFKKRREIFLVYSSTQFANEFANEYVALPSRKSPFHFANKSWDWAKYLCNCSCSVEKKKKKTTW